MKVLILQSELGVLRGGGENFTKSLFNEFAQRGHRVVAAFVADRHGRYPIPLPPSIAPIPIPGWWSRDLSQNMLASVHHWIPRLCVGSIWNRAQEAASWRTIRWHDRRFQKRVERDFTNKWHEFDAVYVHGNSVLAGKIAGYRPTILRLPGPVSQDLEPVLRNIHAVCANGDALLRVREFLHDRVVELPVGIDVGLFTTGSSAVRAQLGWSDRHFVIGYVGRLSHIKGVDILTAAFRQLIKKSQKFRLLIVGHGEQQRPIRVELSREIDAGLVHLEPGVDHEKLCAWYRAMNLMVMPSRYENFSNSVLEALACGIPFLGADVGGNRMIAQGGVGWLFDTGLPCSLAAKIEEVSGDRSELETRGKLARQYVHSHHLWSATAERLEQILASLVGPGR